MTLVDLFRLRWAKLLLGLPSLHRTQGGDICAIQRLVDPFCQRWLGLLGPAAQALWLPPNPAHWELQPHLHANVSFSSC